MCKQERDRPDLSLLENAPDDSQLGLVTDRLPLSVEAAIAAYPQGVSPWGMSDFNYCRWCNPPHRGVVTFADVKVPRSDRKAMRRLASECEVSLNLAFREVIAACATQLRWSSSRFVPLEPTWISSSFTDTYSMLHDLGYAHSFEVWREGSLVAGLYGTFISGLFTGESMFHVEDDAGKLAMAALIEHLAENGHQLLDSKVLCGLSKKWGGRMIAREDFLAELRRAQEQKLSFGDPTPRRLASRGA